MRFDAAIAVADAVLFEGYMLYPYRASATKNRMRWQFGVLVPPAWGRSFSEPSHQQTECLVEPWEDATVHVRVRFLQVMAREVREAASGGDLHPVERLVVDGHEHLPWEEGEIREIDVVARLEDLAGREHTQTIAFADGTDLQPLRDSAGRVAGATMRHRARLEGAIRLAATPLPGPFGAARLRVRVENRSAWRPQGSDRRDALLRSFVSAHTLLSLDGARFVSAADPPEWARPFAAQGANEGTWPVLVGDGGRSLMLSSPIILSDYPATAPESPVDLYDATEIDELLLLRTMTLTDEEKAEARATDPRAASIIDRADHLPPEMLERLHGAIRSILPAQTPPRREAPPQAPWWDPGADASVSPETDSIDIGGARVARGTRVRLHPRRSADAQDMFLDGRTGVVEAVLHDVDGGLHVAVTLEGDDAADLHQMVGRFRYFTPEEIEPLFEGARS